MRVGKLNGYLYKTFSNHFKITIKNAKKNSDKIYIKNLNCPGKAVWDLVGKYTGKSHKKAHFNINDLKKTEKKFVFLGDL